MTVRPRSQTSCLMQPSSSSVVTKHFFSHLPTSQLAHIHVGDRGNPNFKPFCFYFHFKLKQLFKKKQNLPSLWAFAGASSIAGAQKTECHPVPGDMSLSICLTAAISSEIIWSWQRPVPACAGGKVSRFPTSWK